MAQSSWESFLAGLEDEVAEVLALGSGWESLLFGEDEDGEDNPTWQEWLSGSMGILSYFGAGLFTWDLDPDSQLGQQKQVFLNILPKLSDILLQETADLIYVVLWFIHSIGSVVTIPILTYLNGQIKQMDPLLRPAVSGIETSFNAMTAREMVKGYVAEFDPISFAATNSSIVEFDPMTFIVTLSSEVNFDPVVMIP